MKTPSLHSDADIDAGSHCPECWKSSELCLCDQITPMKSPIRILILQHPQEARKPLGTARLLSLSALGAVHVVGHTWRSLGHALGAPKNTQIPLKEWAVLYVGTRKQASPDAKPFELTNRSGEAIKPSTIKGLILLDGNWSQAKTLWWRNSWLLRHPRILLNPEQKSRYNKVRRQPRKNYLSTIEAAALCIENMAPKNPLPAKLRKTFEDFLVRSEPPVVPAFDAVQRIARAKASESSPQV